MEYECGGCGRWIATPDRYGGQTQECPACGNLNVVPKPIGRLWQEWRQRRRNEAAAKARQQEREQVARQRALAIRQQREAARRQLKAHYDAVMTGKVFDLEILVEAFHDDWLAVQRDTGLTPAQIRLGTKTASPAVGAGVWYLTGNPLLGLLSAFLTYAASDSVGDGYAEVKFEEWQLKWKTIFANCSARQLEEFSEALREAYPLVYGSMSSGLPPMLPE